MKKKILIIGNGASAYALAKKLSKDYEIYVTPSSDTLKEFATCLDFRENAVTEILEYVMENDIDMTIPVSEIAINSDIVSKFNENGQEIFAPTKNSHLIISDKSKAKKTMYKLHIPTPKFGIFEKENMVNDYLKNQKIPFVIKTDENKSATILTSIQSAKKILNNMYIEKNKRVVIEDYVYGTPFSFYTITDGYNALPIGSSINYKHALEGEGGQLTSGMGACSPNYKLSYEHEYFIMDNVIYPVIEMLISEGNPYMGILGVNGIITDEGKLQILGWQSFMQDSDAAAVLELIDDDLINLFSTCIDGTFSDEVSSIRRNDSYAVSVVLTCTNKNNTENSIEGLDNLDENTIITYYPSVRKNRYLEYEAVTGSVLTLTSIASTSGRASKLVYDEVENINFKGKAFRKDICNSSVALC
jgi:phosphoribosylamine--glycine ligase